MLKARFSSKRCIWSELGAERCHAKVIFFRLCIKRFQFPFSSSSEGIIFLFLSRSLHSDGKQSEPSTLSHPVLQQAHVFFLMGYLPSLPKWKKLAQRLLRWSWLFVRAQLHFFSLLIFLASLHVADATVEREFFFLLSVTSEVSNSINETPPPAKSFEEKKSRATKSLFFQLSISPRLS